MEKRREEADKAETSVLVSPSMPETPGVNGRKEVEKLPVGHPKWGSLTQFPWQNSLSLSHSVSGESFSHVEPADLRPSEGIDATSAASFHTACTTGTIERARTPIPSSQTRDKNQVIRTEGSTSSSLHAPTLSPSHLESEEFTGIEGSLLRGILAAGVVKLKNDGMRAEISLTEPSAENPPPSRIKKPRAPQAVLKFSKLLETLVVLPITPYDKPATPEWGASEVRVVSEKPSSFLEHQSRRESHDSPSISSVCWLSAPSIGAFPESSSGLALSGVPIQPVTAKTQVPKTDKTAGSLQNRKKAGKKTTNIDRLASSTVKSLESTGGGGRSAGMGDDHEDSDNEVGLGETARDLSSTVLGFLKNSSNNDDSPARRSTKGVIEESVGSNAGDHTAGRGPSSRSSVSDGNHAALAATGSPARVRLKERLKRKTAARSGASKGKDFVSTLSTPNNVTKRAKGNTEPLVEKSLSPSSSLMLPSTPSQRGDSSRDEVQLFQVAISGLDQLDAQTSVVGSPTRILDRVFTSDGDGGGAELGSTSTDLVPYREKAAPTKEIFSLPDAAVSGALRCTRSPSTPLIDNLALHSAFEDTSARPSGSLLNACDSAPFPLHSEKASSLGGRLPAALPTREGLAEENTLAADAQARPTVAPFPFGFQSFLPVSESIRAPLSSQFSHRSLSLLLALAAHGPVLGDPAAAGALSAEPASGPQHTSESAARACQCSEYTSIRELTSVTEQWITVKQIILNTFQSLDQAGRTEWVVERLLNVETRTNSTPRIDTLLLLLQLLAQGHSGGLDFIENDDDSGKKPLALSSSVLTTMLHHLGVEVESQVVGSSSGSSSLGVGKCGASKLDELSTTSFPKFSVNALFSSTAVEGVSPEASGVLFEPSYTEPLTSPSLLSSHPPQRSGNTAKYSTKNSATRKRGALAVKTGASGQPPTKACSTESVALDASYSGSTRMESSVTIPEKGVVGSPPLAAEGRKMLQHFLMVISATTSGAVLRLLLRSSVVLRAALSYPLDLMREENSMEGGSSSSPSFYKTLAGLLSCYAFHSLSAVTREAWNSLYSLLLPLPFFWGEHDAMGNEGTQRVPKLDRVRARYWKQYTVDLLHGLVLPALCFPPPKSKDSGEAGSSTHAIISHFVLERGLHLLYWVFELPSLRAAKLVCVSSPVLLEKILSLLTWIVDPHVDRKAQLEHSRLCRSREREEEGLSAAPSPSAMSQGHLSRWVLGSFQRSILYVAHHILYEILMYPHHGLVIRYLLHLNATSLAVLIEKIGEVLLRLPSESYDSLGSPSSPQVEKTSITSQKVSSPSSSPLVVGSSVKEEASSDISSGGAVGRADDADRVPTAAFRGIACSGTAKGKQQGREGKNEAEGCRVGDLPSAFNGVESGKGVQKKETDSEAAKRGNHFQEDLAAPHSLVAGDAHSQIVIDRCHDAFRGEWARVKKLLPALTTTLSEAQMRAVASCSEGEE